MQYIVARLRSREVAHLFVPVGYIYITPPPPVPPPSSTVVLRCNENEYVRDGLCYACPFGQYKAAGDDRAGGDTRCYEFFWEDPTFEECSTECGAAEWVQTRTVSCLREDGVEAWHPYVCGPAEDALAATNDLHVWRCGSAYCASKTCVEQPACDWCISHPCQNEGACATTGPQGPRLEHMPQAT